MLFGLLSVYLCFLLLSGSLLTRCFLLTHCFLVTICFFPTLFPSNSLCFVITLCFSLNHFSLAPCFFLPLYSTLVFSIYISLFVCTAYSDVLFLVVSLNGRKNSFDTTGFKWIICLFVLFKKRQYSVFYFICRSKYIILFYKKIS